MHARLFALLCWFFATLPLHARLGDTERDCVTRYGSEKQKAFGLMKPDPLVPGARHALYEHQGWQIRVAFLGGIVVAEEYQKHPSHPNGLKIIDAELEAILTAERSTAAWNSPHLDTSKGVSTTVANALLSPMSSRIWDRTDGAKATLLPAHYHLVLETPVAIKAKAAAGMQKEVDKRKNVPKF